MHGVFYPTVTLKRAAAAVVSKDRGGVRAFGGGRAACVIQGSRASPAASNGPERRTLFARLSVGQGMFSVR